MNSIPCSLKWNLSCQLNLCFSSWDIPYLHSMRQVHWALGGIISFCLLLLGRRSKRIPRFPSLLPKLAHTWFAMKLTSKLLNAKAKQHQASKSLIWLWFWNPTWNKKSCKLQSSPQHKIEWHNGLALNAMLLSETTKWFQQGFPACQSCCSVLPPLLPL